MAKKPQDYEALIKAVRRLIKRYEDGADERESENMHSENQLYSEVCDDLRRLLP